MNKELENKLDEFRTIELWNKIDSKESWEKVKSFIDKHFIAK